MILEGQVEYCCGSTATHLVQTVPLKPFRFSAVISSRSPLVSISHPVPKTHLEALLFFLRAQKEIWTIFKLFIEFVTIVLLLFMFLAGRYVGSKLSNQQ